MRIYAVHHMSLEAGSTEQMFVRSEAAATGKTVLKCILLKILKILSTFFRFGSLNALSQMRLSLSTSN